MSKPSSETSQVTRKAFNASILNATDDEDFPLPSTRGQTKSPHTKILVPTSRNNGLEDNIYGLLTSPAHQGPIANTTS